MNKFCGNCKSFEGPVYCAKHDTKTRDNWRCPEHEGRYTPQADKNPSEVNSEATMGVLEAVDWKAEFIRLEKDYQEDTRKLKEDVARLMDDLNCFIKVTNYWYEQYATPDSKWMKQRYEIKPCKKCKIIPRIGYACGEYFLVGTEGCDICDGFTEMHSSAEQEIEVWNERRGEE